MKPWPSIGLLRRGTGMSHVYVGTGTVVGCGRRCGCGYGCGGGYGRRYRYGKKVPLVGTVSSTLLWKPYGVNRIMRRCIYIPICCRCAVVPSHLKLYWCTVLIAPMYRTSRTQVLYQSYQRTVPFSAPVALATCTWLAADLAADLAAYVNLS